MPYTQDFNLYPPMNPPPGGWKLNVPRMIRFINAQFEGNEGTCLYKDCLRILAETPRTIALPKKIPEALRSVGLVIEPFEIPAELPHSLVIKTGIFIKTGLPKGWDLAQSFIEPSLFHILNSEGRAVASFHVRSAHLYSSATDKETLLVYWEETNA